MEGQERRFDHERLDVYDAALEFVAWRRATTRRLPAGSADIADQLSRAASSVVLNIAEGSGEFSRADKVRFYRMARRSATECAAALDIMKACGFLQPDDLLPGRELLWRIVAMLTRLIASRPAPPV